VNVLQCKKTKIRTKTDSDGGTEPQWDEILEIPIVDQYNLMVECWDADALGKDDLIGKTEVSLLPIFKHGLVDNWIPIHAKSKWGGNEAAGELHLIFEFAGPPGVAYPQHQPTMDSFDDSQRKNKSGVERAEKEKKDREDAAEAARKAAEDVGGIPQGARERSDEFSDEEILNAFRFIDLDKNMHIGAAEIRHVLICMGELITDEEVDEMIAMVDSDGDGQVSYQEFYLLVTDPDPSRPDFNVKQGVSAADAVVEGVAPPAGVYAGPPGTVPSSSGDKQKQMQSKQQKKALLDKFAKENHFRIDTIERVWQKFHTMDDGSGQIDFDQFCSLLEVEATGEYKQLFQLFDGDGSGDVDIKEFMLGMLNFTHTDKEKRVHFMFKIFDTDHNGFLTEDELINILAASHMTTEQAVLKKAKTIMKQADKDGNNKISLEEFEVISKKFPNILFPNS